MTSCLIPPDDHAMIRPSLADESIKRWSALRTKSRRTMIGNQHTLNTLKHGNSYPIANLSFGKICDLKRHYKGLTFSA